MKKGVLLLALVLTLGLASTCFAQRGGGRGGGGPGIGRMGGVRVGGFGRGRMAGFGRGRWGRRIGPAFGISVGVPVGHRWYDPYCCWRCRRYGWCPYHTCEYCP